MKTPSHPLRRVLAALTPAASLTARRAILEPLEARIAPAGFTWNSAGGGAWETPANWQVTGTDADGVPDADDDVTINPVAAGVVVTITTAQAAQSLSVPGDDILRLTAGSLTISNASTANAVQVGNATLAANAQLTLTGPASQLNDGGFFSGTIRNEGTLTLSGGVTHISGGTLTNAGTINHLSGRLDFNNEGGPMLRNLAGGLYHVQTAGGAFVGNFSSSEVFENAGTLRCTGTGTADMNGITFNNLGGVIDVVSGSLQLNASGALAGGSYDVAAGATLFLAGGGYNTSGTLGGAGAGTIRFQNATFNGGAGTILDFPVGLFEWGSEGFLTGNFTNDGFIEITDNVVHISGASVLNNAGTITQTGGRLDFNNEGGPALNNLAGALYEVKVAGNNTFVGNFSSSESFNNAGTLRRDGTGNSDMNGITFNNQGGVIDVVSGSLQLNASGALAGGSYNAATGATLSFASSGYNTSGTLAGTGAGTIRFQNSTFNGGAGTTLNFPAGLFEWGTEGYLSGIINNAGFIEITDNVVHITNGGVLNNAGTITQTGGRLDFNTDANPTLNNLAGALYEVKITGNNAFVGNFSGNESFNNFGTLRRDGTMNADMNGITFHNRGGLIEVLNGSLQLNAQGSMTGGTFNVSAGAALSLAGMNHTWTGSFTGAGGGVVLFNNANITPGVSGAALDFPAGMFEWDSEGYFRNGTVTNEGFIKITGGVAHLDGAILNNAGTITQTAGRLDFNSNNAPALNNLAGALYEVKITGNNAFVGNFSGNESFNNAGTLRRDGTANADMNGIAFNNLGGTIDVVNGSLQLNASGALAGGSYHVAAGTTLSLAGGSYAISGTLGGAGAGTIRFQNATFTGSDAATLDFPVGLFEWGTEGYLTGTIANAGFIEITDNVVHISGASVLNNAGTITQTGGRLDFNNEGGPTLNNLEGALYEVKIAADASFVGNFSSSENFNNLGTLRRDGTNTADFNGITFSNAGTVEVVSGGLNVNAALAQLSSGRLNGGTWRAAGGTLTFGAAITANAATLILDGAGSALPQVSSLAANLGTFILAGGADFATAGTLANSGTFIAGPGSVLTVNGAFSNTGRVELQLGGPAASGNFGRIAITGAATLDGTLAAQGADGFAPAAGESYPLITHASRTGAFAIFESGDQPYAPVFELVNEPAQQRVNSLIDAANLALTNVSIPASGLLGEQVTISFTVANVQNRPATAQDWTDAIYLSRDGFFDESDFLFARVPHTGGLGALGSYTENVTRRLPSLPEGEYEVIVVADNRRIVPDLDRANNTRLAGTTLDVDIMQLAFNTPVNGTIEDGQDVFYRLTLPSGPDAFVTGDFALPNAAEFYVRFGAVPDRTTFDFRWDNLASLEKQVRLLNPRGGDYYILLHGREGADPSSTFTLLAEDAPFALDDIAQNTGANVGRVTIPLVGAGFAATLGAELRPAGGGTALVAESIRVVDAANAFATFDLTGVAPGNFTLAALQAGAERLANETFTVQTGEVGRLEARVLVPQAVRMTRPYTITVEFENRGGTDLAAPLFTIDATAGSFVWATGQAQAEQTSTLQFMGVNPTGLNGGVLRPGESYAVVFNAVTNNAAASFTLSSTSSDSVEVVDFDTLRDSLRPSENPTLFDTAFAGVAADLGATYGTMLDGLAAAIDDARRFDVPARTLSEVFGFFVQRELLTIANANVRGTVFDGDAQHHAGQQALYLTNVSTGAAFETFSFYDGTFGFLDVPAGTYALSITDFLSDSVETVVVPASGVLSGVSVIGDAGETLSGRIVDATGRAVVGALVTATGALGREVVRSTDRNGAYTIPGLAPGATLVDVRAANLLPLDDAAVTLVAGTRDVLDLTLRAGGAIEGRVLNGTAAVANADIFLHLAGEDSGVTARTDAAGRFRVAGLAAGIYEVVALAAGAGVATQGSILVGENATTPISDLTLGAAARVFGKVTDAVTGQAITGAEFASSSLVRTSAPVLTAATGNYSAPDLAPGAVEVVISAPGYNETRATLTLTAGENEMFDLTLRPLGVVSGEVRLGGTLAAGVLVELTPLDEESFVSPVQTMTDANGAYRFDGLLDGDYAVTLSTSVDRAVVTLDTADNTQTANFSIGAGNVTGVLRDSGGQPLGDRAVQLFRNGVLVDTATTDDAGRYRFIVFQGGAFDLVALEADFGFAAQLGVTLNASGAQTLPDLTPGAATLTADVFSAAMGAPPVEKALVAVRRIGGATFDLLNLYVRTDDAGAVTLPGLAPGDYEVTVSAAGFAPAHQVVTVGAGGADVDLSLAAGREVSGTVRGPDGAPVTNGVIALVHRVTGDVHTTITDEDGAFSEDSLAAGIYDVIVAGAGLRPQIFAAYEVSAAAQTIEVNLAASGATVAGTVLDAQGRPLAGAVIAVLGPGGVAMLSTLTDEAGAYELPFTPAGTQTVKVTAQGLLPVSIDVSVPASGTASQPFTLGSAVATDAPVVSALPRAAQAEAAKGEPPTAIGNTVFDSPGLNPPKRFDGDTSDFRNGFRANRPDPDNRDLNHAYDRASESSLLVDQAFDALNGSYAAVRDQNRASFAELGQASKDFANRTISATALLSDIASAAGKAYAGKILDPTRAVPGFLGAAKGFLDDAATAFRNLDFAAAKEALGFAQAAAMDAWTAFKDFKNLAGPGVAEELIKSFNVIESLNNLADASLRYDADVVKRYREYGEAEDRYQQALLKHKANLDALEAARKNAEKKNGETEPDPEDPEDKKEEDKKDVPSVGSRDPNDIIGPAGFGPLNYIAADSQFDYTIRFENIATATAAAQEVFITQTLDANLDPATFQLSAFGFGGQIFAVPAGRDYFSARMDFTATLGLLVEVEAKIDVASGALSWTFRSLDPQTLDLTGDPFAGFLPPNATSPEGEGFVSYSVRPDANAPSGTRIDAQASIVFDTNAPIDTPAIFHTLDAEAPTSAITPLAATLHGPRVTLTVGGDDGAGSGLRSFDLYVSVDGGPFTFYRNDVPAGSYTFRGESGRTYGFASAAKDNVGLTEALSLTPDATTTLDFASLLFTKAAPLKFTDADGDQVTIKLKGAGNGSIILDDPDGDGRGSIEFLALDGSTAKSKLSVSVKKKAGGDGAATIGDVNIDGALGAFTAKQADLVANGLVAGGNVKQIAVRDLLQPEPVFAQPLVQLAAAASDSTSITARVLADGFAIATAGAIKKLSVGDLGAGTITAATIKKLDVKTGDLAADIRLSGALGAVNVKKGGLDGATVTAATIGNVKVKTDVVNAIILAGADLGDDGMLGAGNDTFAPGSIGKVSIGGAVTASVLGAGFSSADAVFKNADDLILGGTASKIASLTVKGQADAASYFAAGKFTKKPKIAGATVDPTTDPRFLVG